MQTQPENQTLPSLPNHHFEDSAREFKIERTPPSLEEIAESFERIFPLLDPVQRLHYVATSTDLPAILTTSGGIQSAVLLSSFAELRNTPIEHDTKERIAGIPILFLDTGDLYPETHAYLDYLSSTLNLTIQRFRHALKPEEFRQNLELLQNSGLSKSDAFDQLTKVRPMQQIIEDLGVQIWISGNRRDQSPSRNQLPFAEVNNGVIKVYPLADVKAERIPQILEERRVQHHPLSKVYRSVGNQHDTLPATEGHEKSGRHNAQKDECGLHLGWVNQGKTLVYRNEYLVPATRFPLVRDTINPGV